MGFPYHLSHHHVYELTGHQLQSASAVPFSIDGLLNGSCAASVGNSNPLLSSGCGMNGDNQHYKLTGKPCLHSPLLNNISSRNKDRAHKFGTRRTRRLRRSLRLPLHFKSSQMRSCTREKALFLSASKPRETAPISGLCFFSQKPADSTEAVD